MTFIIDTLPDSLVYLILQELDGICLVRIALVSKSMLNFANNDELWEFVCGFCKKDACAKDVYELQVNLDYENFLMIPIKYGIMHKQLTTV